MISKLKVVQASWSYQLIQIRLKLYFIIEKETLNNP